MEKSNISNDYAAYLFHQGTNYRAYEYLGCHGMKTSDGYEYTFRVWAPNATGVSLVSDFLDWEYGMAMQRITDKGVWECKYKSSSLLDGKFYKYKVTNNGASYYKADPYAFYSQTNLETASIVCDINGFSWNDGDWFEYRKTIFSKNAGTKNEKYFYSAPMNIYEMHLGSWKTRDGKSTSDGNHYLNYREIADELAPYVKKMGYTHIELMPVMEHPYDGSWGYQVCGYYAPTSRFGSPRDFMYFMNKMHECGIGVILDWVPAHFPKDRHGLYEFDGQPLYEYQGKDRMEHKVWGTRFFDVGREEVQSFLISNALFWLDMYHADGIRIDAVASMLYLDYDRNPGEWVPNDEGNNKNKEAISFFRKLNTAVFAVHPDVLMIAEESTDWPMITKPVASRGLGFNYKWNMGWANDIFDYIATDPVYRKYKHDELTFPLMYIFNENYVLPVSHDEVVHGKKSLVDKMFGSYDEKFSAMRTFLTYMMTTPGKKMLFMGTEFAQFREWDFENPLEWFMLKYPRHTEMQRFVSVLNNFYLASPALWEKDNSWDGYEWIEAGQADLNVISYRRKPIKGDELAVVINFSPVKRERYRVYVPLAGKYEEVLTTDEYRFGGGGILNTDIPKTKKDPDGNRDYIEITLPALSGVILRRQKRVTKKG